MNGQKCAGWQKLVTSISATMIVSISFAQHTPTALPIGAEPLPEQDCLVEVAIASVGQPISLLFEPALQTAAGEQLVYDTLMGSFVSTGPSLITWVPACPGWDFIQVRAVDTQGNSRVVARVDFVVDDESQLVDTYNLTVEVEGRGWIVPLSEGGVQYAAIWLDDEVGTQELDRPRRGGQLCLKRPDPPPGLNCGSMPPEGIWVCPPYANGDRWCTGLKTCQIREDEVVVVVCGEEAARLRVELGLQRGCKVIGSFEYCVVEGGCVKITSRTRTTIQCQQCTVQKKQYCRRFCCRNNVVECCEQHLYMKTCHYRRLWLPSGPVNSPEVCDPPLGPYTQPGCNW